MTTVDYYRSDCLFFKKCSSQKRKKENLRSRSLLVENHPRKNQVKNPLQESHLGVDVLRTVGLCHMEMLQQMLRNTDLYQITNEGVFRISRFIYRRNRSHHFKVKPNLRYIFIMGMIIIMSMVIIMATIM